MADSTISYWITLRLKRRLPAWRYPCCRTTRTRPHWLQPWRNLAIEELTHYREVVKWIHSRGLVTTADTKDHYVIAFREHMRKGRDEYLLDRLLIAGIIEARGAERFGLVAAALEPGPLQKFYQSITRSEERHYQLFLDLASEYLPQPMIRERWDALLNVEADIVAALPPRAALH